MIRKFLSPNYQNNEMPSTGQEYETVEFNDEGWGTYIDPIFDVCWRPHQFLDSLVMPSQEELEFLVKNGYPKPKGD